LEASFQHYRANNFENRNKVIWNNTDFRLFNRDNPRSLGGPIPILGETSVIPLVREQRKIRGINPRMPLEDPQIRLKLGLRLDSDSQLDHNNNHRFEHDSKDQQFLQQKMMLGSMQNSDQILRYQNQIRDSFLTVAPTHRQ
jgi:hypothetical protein